MSQDKKLKLFLCQISSSPNYSENLEKARRLIESSQSYDPDLIIFPENVLCRSHYDAIRKAAKSEAYFEEELGSLSQEFKVNVVWGGIPVRYGEGLFNQAMVINTSGKLLTKYQKIHLFEFHGFGKSVDESTLYSPGTKPVSFKLKGWEIGLSICYDLRFPELFRYYAGLDLVLCPSDFTYYTGEMHWETLLRARAIENQCYVAGVNQCGQNSGLKVKSYGHTMLIDPWGNRQAAAAEIEGALEVEINRENLSSVRQQIPALLSIKQPSKW